MLSTPAERLLVLLPAGLGLLAVGTAFLVWPRAARVLRLAVAVGVSVFVAGGLTAITDWKPAAVASGGMLVLASLAAVVGTDWLAILAAWIRRPTVRWATVALVGVTTTLVSLAQYECDSDDLANSVDRAESSLIDDLSGMPSSTLLTDAGNAIVVKQLANPRTADALARSDDRMFHENGRAMSMIRRQSAFEQANCHGWVFAAGRFWIGGNSVDAILADNHYQPTTTPQPGDVIVYRTSRLVTHSGVVRYVTPGQPVMVESKWGRLGVYLHSADESCYGAEFTYYRSPRDGHTLTGATGG